MSKIAFEMRDQMDSMSDTEFENAMSLSKAAFLDYLDQAEAGEKRCQVSAGRPAPDFSAHVLCSDGSVSSDLLNISDLRGSPTSLIFGSYTCPIFRRQSERMKQLIAEFEHLVQFLFVYTLEAHATDGWNTNSNRADQIMYAQPVNMEERAKVAHDWRRAYSFSSKVVLDWPDNRINDDYAGAPERLYVLDAKGVVTFKSEQGPYHDSHLEDWAVALKKAATDVVDTVLNIGTFAFIGAMVWLMIRKRPQDRDDND